MWGATLQGVTLTVSPFAPCPPPQVLAAVRGPIVVMLGVMLFAEAVTIIEFVGYSIALTGA